MEEGRNGLVSPNRYRILHLQRESEDRISYELADGTSRTIELDPAVADLLMDAWEDFLVTQGRSDAPGG